MSFQKEHLYALIGAGGKGERLWPLSRKDHPKQLLRVTNKTLLEESIDRLSFVIATSNMTVVTTSQQESYIKEACNKYDVSVIAEPSARNTSAACLFGAMSIYKKDPEAIILFAPADHVIDDGKGYAATIESAIREAIETHCITLVGVVPRTAHTGYGYIQYSPNSCSKNNGYLLTKFHEKPKKELAAWYAAQSDMLWNIGIICAPIKVLLDAFKTYAPDILKAFEDFTSGSGLYENIPSISIDYAILEKVAPIRVMRAEWTWHDIGDLRHFIPLQQTAQKYHQQTIEIKSSNNLVHVPNKLVALVDIHNLCIIETEDVLCITTLETADQVKVVLNQLAAHGLQEYT